MPKLDRFQRIFFRIVLSSFAAEILRDASQHVPALRYGTGGGFLQGPRLTRLGLTWLLNGWRAFRSEAIEPEVMDAGAGTGVSTFRLFGRNAVALASPLELWSLVFR